jgi:ligand-binding SRPBCC domain-containing protein
LPTIRLETYINADAERCFDLSRNVDIHLGSLARTKERAIDGVTSGLMDLQDTVTWEGAHFGFRRRLTIKITEFERPHHFTDEMVRGPLKKLRHVHEFVPRNSGTLMLDTFVFESRFSFLGWLVDRLLLSGYFRRLLTERNDYIRRAAEHGFQHKTLRAPSFRWFSSTKNRL